MTRLVVGICLVCACGFFFGLEYLRFLQLAQPTMSHLFVFVIVGVPTGVGCWLVDSRQRPKSKLELRMERLMAPYQPR